jgi:hypothetical protein
VVVGGEVPVINGGDGAVDDDPGVTASTRVRLGTSETSCGGGEWWPESAAASDVVEMLEALRFRTNRRRQWMLRREGGREKPEGGHGALCTQRNSSSVVGFDTDLRRAISVVWWCFRGK